MGEAAGQEFPEGQRRTLDEEERRELLRLQEPCRRGQGVQADPQMGCTDAAVHDSQKLDDVLDLSNTGKKVWADSAYRSPPVATPVSFAARNQSKKTTKKP